MNQSVPKKILVVRNDKLGDFMLSFPALALLRQYLPETEIHVLVQDYTQPMARLCNAIDVIQIDPGPAAGWNGLRQLTRHLRAAHYDAVVTLFSTTRLGLALALAKIPYRLAPATKLAQVFYPRRLRQRRSESAKPEFVYNRDLAEQLLHDFGIPVTAYPVPPFLSFPESLVSETRRHFIQRYKIDAHARLVFLHPGSGGSANNLSLPQYAELAMNLQSPQAWQLVITAGPGEETVARKLAKMTADLEPVVHVSTEGLEVFARHLALADVFISGSTGPLHIAGALDRPTAAFYTRRRSATALRWQTLNSESRRLRFSPPEEAAAEDMLSIDVPAAARQISHTFL